MTGKGKQLLLSIVDTVPAACHDAIKPYFLCSAEIIPSPHHNRPGRDINRNRTILESEVYVYSGHENNFGKHSKRYLLTLMCREHSEQDEPLWKMETKIGQNDMGR